MPFAGGLLERLLQSHHIELRPLTSFTYRSNWRRRSHSNDRRGRRHGRKGIIL